MKSEQICTDTLDRRMAELYQLADAAADADTTILVTGPSGSGKEVLARRIHAHSKRIHQPYLPVSCANIPATLMEAELFGHDAGAFTGADGAHAGKFEQAGSGTIVLDEIGDASPELQAKLLRVLETREFYRIGGTTPIRISARIIAITSRDLEALVREGEFRADLFYRLDALRLEVPALAEHRRDIPLLADFFLADLNRRTGSRKFFSPEVYHVLTTREWDGHVRELKNFVTRLFYLSSEDAITSRILATGTLSQNSANIELGAEDSVHLSLAEMEKRFILHSLNHCNGNKSQTARKLKISLKTLRSKLKEYRMEELHQVIATHNVQSRQSGWGTEI